MRLCVGDGRWIASIVAVLGVHLGSTLFVGAQPSSPVATYPAQPVRLVVPFSAGSATDIVARTIGEKLSEKWGQQVVIDNRPGLVGTTFAAKSVNDGYTLMLTSNGHAVAGIFNKTLQFDPVKDFAGISQIASGPLVMLISPELAATTVPEFIAIAKQKPGALNFASHGYGSTLYVAGELFKRAANIDIVHVPYKGAPDALTGIMRGDSHLYFAGANVAGDLMTAGKVRALAITADERLSTLPDLPTVAESGLPQFSYDTWIGLFAPAGIPPAIAKKIGSDVVQIMNQPEMRDRLLRQGFKAHASTPETFSKLLETDVARFTELFRQTTQ